MALSMLISSGGVIVLSRTSGFQIRLAPVSAEQAHLDGFTINPAGPEYPPAPVAVARLRHPDKLPAFSTLFTEGQIAPARPLATVIIDAKGVAALLQQT